MELQTIQIHDNSTDRAMFNCKMCSKCMCSINTDKTCRTDPNFDLYCNLFAAGKQCKYKRNCLNMFYVH